MPICATACNNGILYLPCPIVAAALACLIRGRSTKGLNCSRAAAAYHLLVNNAGNLHSNVRQSRLWSSRGLCSLKLKELYYSQWNPGRKIKAVQKLMLTRREELCGQEQWSKNGASDCVVGSLIHSLVLRTGTFSVWFSNQRNPMIAS